MFDRSFIKYNENQGYSAETLAKLNELSPQYLAALVSENGQLTLNTDLLQLEYESLKETSFEKDDVVELSEVYNVAELGTGINKKIRYIKRINISFFNYNYTLYSVTFSYVFNVSGFTIFIFFVYLRIIRQCGRLLYFCLIHSYDVRRVQRSRYW